MDVKADFCETQTLSCAGSLLSSIYFTPSSVWNTIYKYSEADTEQLYLYKT
jgi:hypothetical protein